MTDSSSSRDLEAEIAGTPREERPSERHARKAEGFYKRALAIREKVLEPDHPDIADSLYNLGQLGLIRLRPADGEKYMERWLKLPEAAKASASERRAKVLFMLARASMERKDWDDAARRLAMAQELFEGLNGAESNAVSIMLAARIDVALSAGRFDDAEGLIKRNLEIQAAILGPDEADIVQVRRLMAGNYRDHAGDRRAPLLWHRLNVLKERTELKRDHSILGEIIDGYADLLRRTNRVVPRPTEDDLAYLKKAGVVLAMVDLDDLESKSPILDFNLDDQGLTHIARMHQIERLHLNGSSYRGKSITDFGLGHLKDLVNLSDLSLSTADITDAGLAHLTGLENLEKLNLRSTRVSDAGLVHLKGLKQLRELGLAFTNVTDAGLEILEGLASLRSLDLRHTRVTEAAVQRLRRQRPDLQIEHESGAGYIRPTVPPGFEPDATVRTKPAPAAVSPLPAPPGKP